MYIGIDYNTWTTGAATSTVITYHCLEINEKAVIDTASMAWLVSSEKYCHVVFDGSQGEVGTGRRPGAIGNRAGPLAYRRCDTDGS